MDCTHCESVLLDLCYGELPPAQEREVRAHIHECPTCRKALSRLEAGQALARHLPDEAPSAELTDKILRAAQSHLRQRGTPLERLQGYLESFARIAMTRQVAMATMSLLIVFVGLWSIPELTQRRDARSVTVEAPPGEAGPSAAVAAEPSAVPAQPLAELDAPAVSQGAAEGSGGPPRRAAVEAAAKRARSAPALAGRELERAKSKAEALPNARRRQFATAPPPAAALAEDEPLDGLSDGLSDFGAAAERKDAAAQKADKLAVGNASGDLVARKPQPTGAPVAPAAPLSRAEPDMLRAESRAAPTTIEDMYLAGVERYRAEDYVAASQLFARMLQSSAPSAQRAAALLYLARSERALGRCDKAIRAYETLVRSYGSAQQSSIALSEGVACYDQLGDSAGAQRLLEHATSVPSLSAQAMQRLHDRSPAKPAEPAAPASAAPPRP